MRKNFGAAKIRNEPQVCGPESPPLVEIILKISALPLSPGVFFTFKI